MKKIEIVFPEDTTDEEFARWAHVVAALHNVSGHGGEDGIVITVEDDDRPDDELTDLLNKDAADRLPWWETTDTGESVSA